MKDFPLQAARQLYTKIEQAQESDPHECHNISAALIQKQRLKDFKAGALWAAGSGVAALAKQLTEENLP
jgi:hypothetical protein